MTMVLLADERPLRRVRLRFEAAMAGGSRRTACLVAVLIGLAMVAATFPLDRLWPGAGAGDIALVGDPAQHVIAQRYFIAGPWGWPLLAAHGLTADDASVAMTDGIPLLALLLKLFRFALPPGFHGVFLWIALCWVLQPVAAVYALRSAGERRLLPAIVVAVLAANLPTLLARSVHAALNAHFLLLFALGLTFRICRERRPRDSRLAGGLMLASLLIHPYLMVMVVAVLAAAPLSLLIRRDPGWRAVRIAFAANLAVTLAAAVLLGYLRAAPLYGYGLFSMNLLAPFYPLHSGLWSPPDWTASGPPPGQAFEGYQYLGAGVLLLLVAAACALRRSDIARLRRHAGLLLCCLALILVALSTKVYLGPWLVLDLGTPSRLMGQWRAGGRFFWPCAYLALILGVVFTARLRPALAVPALLAALVLQLADAAPLRAAVAADMHAHPAWLVDAPRLRTLLAQHRTLSARPPIGCGRTFSDDRQLMQLLLLASERAMPVDTAYVARQTAPIDCSPASLAAPPLPGELVAYVPSGDPALPRRMPGHRDLCRRLGDLVLCTSRPDLLAGLPPLP